jgi:hypothetical protein
VFSYVGTAGDLLLNDDDVEMEDTTTAKRPKDSVKSGDNESRKYAAISQSDIDDVASKDTDAEMEDTSTMAVEKVISKKSLVKRNRHDSNTIDDQMGDRERDTSQEKEKTPKKRRVLTRRNVFPSNVGPGVVTDAEDVPPKSPPTVAHYIAGAATKDNTKATSADINHSIIDNSKPTARKPVKGSVQQVQVAETLQEPKPMTQDDGTRVKRTRTPRRQTEEPDGDAVTEPSTTSHIAPNHLEPSVNQIASLLALWPYTYLNGALAPLSA